MRFKKYLGQNFLKNRKIAERIMETGNVNSNDAILEVGPGTGALTKLLIQKAKQVVAVEKDKELADFLMDRFKKNTNLSIIRGDILKIKKLPRNYKIIANIPYYITSRFLRKFLESKNQPKLMVLMVQKEVAERIVAHNQKESLLSISVKSYGQPKIIADVSAKNFFPMPKVDSAILLIDNISKDFFKSGEINEKKFFALAKQGFSQKRKLLKNNLKLPDAITLEQCGVSPLARAENLSLEQWKKLYIHLDVRHRVFNKLN